MFERDAELTECDRIHSEGEWPSSSRDLNYHIWGAMLEKKYYNLQPKPKTTDELKVALKTIWEELPQEHINKAVANFTKCLTAYMATWLYQWWSLQTSAVTRSVRL